VVWPRRQALSANRIVGGPSANLATQDSSANRIVGGPSANLAANLSKPQNQTKKRNKNNCY
jgi:hypothetical protein